MKLYSVFIVFLFFSTSLIQAPPDTLWTRVFGGNQPGCDPHSGDAGRSIQQTYDGGYIIAGWTHSFDAVGSDMRIIRTNELGDSLWTCQFGDSTDNVAYAIQETRDQGFIVVGFNAREESRGG